MKQENPLKNYFVNNAGNYIHVIESGERKPDSPSILIVGGIWDSAERAMPVHQLDRHVVSFSFRGRGLSSTPETGYTLEDHLTDIEKVVEASGLIHYCMVGFSRGAAYTLGWYFKALENIESHEKIAGLILVDQAPIHRQIPEKSLDFWCNMVYQGVPVKNHMRNSAFEGLSREAQERDFTPNLDTIDVPVSVFYGTGTDSGMASNLPADIRETYRERIKNIRFVAFTNSGHMIPDDETDKYLAEIDRFVGTLG